MSKVTCPYHGAGKSASQQDIDLGRFESTPPPPHGTLPPATLCYTDVTNHKKELLGKQNAAITVSFSSFYSK